MPSPSRYYSSTAAKTTLSSSIDSSSASMLLAAPSGLPSQYPFTLILEKDTANEEIVTVTNLVGSSYSITRGVDGSTAKAHSVGATVEHGVSARDYSESRSHEVATNAHGVTGDVVGTGGAQTLTSKTLTTATLGSILDAGNFKITNLATPTSSSDAVRKDFADAQVTAAASSATAAATSATSAANSATAATTSATSASNSATAAATSAASALASQTAAATSAASAATSASTMLASVTTAATSAASALASQTAAATSATSAATSATSAANSATAAATSATSAANSATAAANSVASIASYATAAATSATSAANSATAAATSAASAAASATAASTSASSAAASFASVTGLTGSGILRDLGTITESDTTTTTYLNVATLTASAQTSATSAATSASSAATSASSAAASDVSAQNWATQLSTPVAGGEYSAKYHAQAAATSATSAATSASSAAASAALIGSAISAQIVDAKGDLIVASAADTVTRLAVGSDGFLLTASSTATNGVTWAAAPISLPSQSGNDGRYLTTNGSTASWATIVTDPLPDVFMMMGA